MVNRKAFRAQAGCDTPKRFPRFFFAYPADPVVLNEPELILDRNNFNVIDSSSLFQALHS
jgi:hypothetical protein